MKKLFKILILSLITIASISSCTKILLRTPQIDNFDKLDFSEYTKMGFLFTPLLYSGEYESIGLINYRFFPSATYIDTIFVINGVKWPLKYWKSDEYSHYDILDSIYSWSSKKGANAIVNLKLQVAQETFGLGEYKNPTMVFGIDVSGFAIKRK